MKKITITAFLLLSSVLYSELFEHNTDVKSKYRFDMTVAQENEDLASKLKKFQSGEVSEEEINIYLKAKDDNKTAPLNEDILVDKSLQIGTKEEVEEVWFAPIVTFYNSLFDTKENATVVEQNSSVEEETPVIDEEVPATEVNPEQGVE